MRQPRHKITHARIKALYNPRFSDLKNARNMKLSQYAVADWRKENKIPAWNKTVNEYLFFRYYNLGCSDCMISRILDVNHARVWRFRNDLGLPVVYYGKVAGVV